MNIETNILNHLHKIKEQTPIIHNITNLVVMTSSANLLLALGASPIMAHCESEVEEIVSISKALVLNIGTIDNTLATSMIKASKVANHLKVPVVLDIVGAGASQLRARTVTAIMEHCKLSVLRGNASELLAITNGNIISKGVDSTIAINEKIITTAKKVAQKNSCTVAITGKKDIITDGFSTTRISNGHQIMTKITGMGCGLTAFTGAFCAVEESNYAATVAAFALYGICGDIAAKICGNNPGSFFMNFLDVIYRIRSKSITDLIKAEID